MGMEENGGAAKCILSGWSAAARPCDWCKAAAALLFCRPDKAFMCMACDAKAHGASRHERVWMCEVCEQAPASVTCKADAAALCVTCDRDIHSANPLARRHERVPVVPFFDTADSVVKSAASFLVPACDHHPDTTTGGLSDVEAPHASWILSNPNPSKLPGDDPDMKSFELIFSEPDHFLDLDSVVPVQPVKPLPPPQLIEHFPESRFEIDFNRSNLNSYNSSYTQSVSSSSMDVGLVPDGTSMSDISYPFALHLNSSVDPSGSTNGNQAPQLSGLDREARVMRYREKRKNRKFEKTIRYASRKAYAETRPRIKGRFAKRPETDPDVDHWFTAGSTAFMGGDPSGYGVVPSF